MSDAKWSEWIEWKGGNNPLSPMEFVEIMTRDGDTEDGESGAFYWHHDKSQCDIIAYRYQLKDQSEVTEAEEEEWQRMDKEQSRKQYSAYYKDVRHIEYIDVYRVVSLFECEKHGHPISHAAKKLLLTGARTGGKDVEQDVREAIDSLYRWMEMREEDKRAL